MINYKWNSKFQEVIESQGIITNEVDLPASLKLFLNKGIVQKDDCFYFKDFACNYSEDFYDKTGSECFNNKFYIDNFVNGDINEEIQIGVTFVKTLAKLLESYNYSFCIILDYHDESVDIQFHKVRENEIWLMDNIDEYEEALYLAYVNE